MSGCADEGRVRRKIDLVARSPGYTLLPCHQAKRPPCRKLLHRVSLRHRLLRAKVIPVILHHILGRKKPQLIEREKL